jgi:hypothetical protein
MISEGIQVSMDSYLALNPIDKDAQFINIREPVLTIPEDRLTYLSSPKRHRAGGREICRLDQDFPSLVSTTNSSHLKIGPVLHE